MVGTDTHRGLSKTTDYVAGRQPTGKTILENYRNYITRTLNLLNYIQKLYTQKSSRYTKDENKKCF